MKSGVISHSERVGSWASSGSAQGQPAASVPVPLSGFVTTTSFGPAGLHALPGEGEPLPVRGNPLLVLDLRLDVLDRVGRLDVERDRLAGRGLEEELHGVRRQRDAEKDGENDGGAQRPVSREVSPPAGNAIRSSAPRAPVRRARPPRSPSRGARAPATRASPPG